MELNTLYNEANTDTMSKMTDDFLSGIITSPPYNVATKRTDYYYETGYSKSDNLSEEDYLNLRINEFKEFERVVKKDGVICYNISYHNENPILPLMLINKIHNETNLTLADIIAWKKSNALPFQTSPTKLSRIVENIYVIVNKEHLHTFKTNKIVSSINEKTGQKFYKNYINFIEARNNDGFKTNLKATFSTELVSKLIEIYFPENSIIYDPFMGIGTTAKGCIINKCKFIGSEISKEFFKDSITQLNNLKNEKS